MANKITGGSIIWNLDVDDSKLKSGLSEAKSNVESAAKSIDKSGDKGKSGIEKISTSMKNAESASITFKKTIVGALSAAATAVVGIGLKTAGEYERLRISLATVTGDVNSANEAFKIIQKTAKESPFFEVSTLAEFVQKMAAAGKTIDDAVKSGIGFGDVMAAFGKGNYELERMGNTLTQVIGKGKADTVDFKELVNAGWVSVRKDVSETMGISMAEFEALLKKGKITYSEIEKASAKYAGSAERQSNTMNALWQRLKETISATFADVVVDSGIFDTVKNGISKIIDVLEELDVDKIKKFLNDIRPVIYIVGGAIMGAMVPALGAMATAAWAAIAPLLPFIAIGAAVGAVIWGIITVVRNWDKIMETLKNTLSTVGEAIGGFFSKIGEWFGNVFTKIGEFFTNVGNKISEFFKSIPGKISNFLKTLGNLFLDGLKFVGSLFTYWIPYIVGYIIGIVISLPGKIKEILTDVINNIKKWATDTWDYLSIEIPKLITNILNWFAELPGKIKTTLGNVLSNIKQWGVDTWNYLSVQVTSWITNIVKWFKELPGKIKDGLSSLGSTIKSSFSGAWNNLVSEISQWPSRIWDWGKNIANSFIEGFKNALKSIGSAFTKGINDAKDSMKGNSPPKEGPLKEIDKWGENIGSAWVEGFAKSISGIGSFMDSSFDRLQGIMNPDFAYAGNTQNITIQNVNVKDKSDIDALTRALGYKLSTI